MGTRLKSNIDWKAEQIVRTAAKEPVMFCLGYSIRHIPKPTTPGPLHLPVPAALNPGGSAVLHGPPAATAYVRGAGGHVGRLPATDEAGTVGLLDLANHAVTVTSQRGALGHSPFFHSLAQGFKWLSSPTKALHLHCLGTVLRHAS